MFGSVVMELCYVLCKPQNGRVKSEGDKKNEYQILSDALNLVSWDEIKPNVKPYLSDYLVFQAAVCKWLLDVPEFSYEDEVKNEGIRFVNILRDFWKRYYSLINYADANEANVELDEELDNSEWLSKWHESLIRYLACSLCPIALYANSVKRANDLVSIIVKVFSEKIKCHYPNPKFERIKKYPLSSFPALTKGIHLRAFNVIKKNSDSYSHVVSIQEIIDYVISCTPCAMPRFCSRAYDKYWSCFSIGLCAFRDKKYKFPIELQCYGRTRIGGIGRMYELKLAGDGCFPIHDNSLYPNLHSVFPDCFAKQMIPAEILSLFEQIEHSIYERGNANFETSWC